MVVGMNLTYSKLKNFVCLFFLYKLQSAQVKLKEFFMTEINFITSNQGKIKALENSFRLYNMNVLVHVRNLDIIEPQFDTVQEVSKFKALKAFEEIKEPVLVEDGGLSIEALNGFPGVYTKYVLKTISIDGILRLMQNCNNRAAKFVSVATFVDEVGEVFQFNREGGEFEISSQKVDIESPFAWSELWKILYLNEFEKNLCELTQKELTLFYQQNGANGSIQKFAKWYTEKYNNKLF